MSQTLIGGALHAYLHGETVTLHFPPEAGKVRRDSALVVLVHGLFHGSFVMAPLAKYLAEAGFDCWSFDYRTTRSDVAGHAARLGVFLQELAASHPNCPLHLVTHSMGGLVTRYALGSGAAGQVMPARVVMLAPPNSGSYVAMGLMKLMPQLGKLIRPLPELAYGDDSPVHRIPELSDCELLIIAGRYDPLVPVHSTRPTGKHHFKLINSSHSEIMYRPAVHRMVRDFLETGAVAEDAE